MSSFPSIWQLLLPNFNPLTVLGFIALVVGCILLYLSFRYGKILEKVINSNGRILSLIIIAGGIVTIWGFSILEDLLNSTGGLVLILGTIIVAVVWFVLFYKPKKGKKKK